MACDPIATEVNVRMEVDSLGEIGVPADKLYGAQTQRAIVNFPISGLTLPRNFIRALGLVKFACAGANVALGDLELKLAESIQTASLAVANGDYDSHFPIDVFQTGSGTSSNMNANEVIARLSSNAMESEVHPNNHVNMSQSSNDVIPTAIYVGATLMIVEQLEPALRYLVNTIKTKSLSVQQIVKTGRTHLMDAMPITLGQELQGWAAQIASAEERLNNGLVRLRQLAIGGTAVGTGVNADPEFGHSVSELLSRQTGMEFHQNKNLCAAVSNLDAAVEMSGHLKTLAVSLMKISNDLRWMNSGPLAGLGEITLRKLQPGSSIMPGKVNPVIAESACMVCAQVIGNDTTITVAGQSGNFQLNVMMPVIAYNLMQSIEILSTTCRSLADNAISDFSVNGANIERNLYKNPILITALNQYIGYELGAKIAEVAATEQRSIVAVAKEMTDLDPDLIDQLLDPSQLTVQKK